MYLFPVHLDLERNGTTDTRRQLTEYIRNRIASQPANTVIHRRPTAGKGRATTGERIDREREREREELLLVNQSMRFALLLPPPPSSLSRPFFSLLAFSRVVAAAFSTSSRLPLPRGQNTSSPPPPSSFVALAPTVTTTTSLGGATTTAGSYYDSCYYYGRRKFGNYRRQHRNGRCASSYYSRHRTVSSAGSSDSGRFMSSSSEDTGETSEGPPRSDEQLPLLRVALCQFPVAESKRENLETCRAYVDEAATKFGARLVVLPEIWNSPYATAAFPEYSETLPDVVPTATTTPKEEKDQEDGTSNSGNAKQNEFPDAPSVQLLRDMAAEHGVWLVGGSIPEKVPDEKGDELYYNTCLVFDPSGALVAKHRKVHLFDIDVPGKITFKESDTLSPGQSYTSFRMPIPSSAGSDDGDGNVKAITVGIGICYDIRFAEYAMALCQDDGDCRILVYPGAFNLTTGPAHWELLQRGRAVDNQCFVLTASPARTEAPGEGESSAGDEKKKKYPHYAAWGHSTAVSPWGAVLATTDEKPGIVVTDLDLAEVDSVRTSIPILKQKRPDLYQLVKKK